MKMRIKGNALRLRLGQSEVERMITKGVVAESITFGGGGRQRLEYILCSTPDARAVTAVFDDGRVVVRVPSELVHLWGTTDQVGIDAAQTTPGGEVLNILIEKDFECLDAPVGESQEDAFRRPHLGLACAASATPEHVVANG